MQVAPNRLDIMVGLMQVAKDLGFEIIYRADLFDYWQTYGRVGYGDKYNVIELYQGLDLEMRIVVLIHELAHILGEVGEDRYGDETEAIVDTVTHFVLTNLELDYARSRYASMTRDDRSLDYEVYNKHFKLIDAITDKMIDLYNKAGV